MKVFASAVGQHDNLGDTVLRRAFLRTVRRAGQLHVYVGRPGDDQVSALGLEADDVVVRTSSEWRAELRRTLGRTPALYSFDTGEKELERRFALRYLRTAPLLVANRLRGGASVHLGVGLRRATPWRYPMAAVLRLCQEVTWRDEHSHRWMGVGRTAPDWAFHEGASTEELRAQHPRDVLAVALRASLPHDRRPEPSSEWAHEVAAAAGSLGLRPVFTAQIGRDGELASRLADAVGAEAMTWGSAHHGEMEARLRPLYRRSAVIVSDRLHGLVIAATEGASPLALSSGPLDKATRTLAAAGLSEASVQHSPTSGAAVARALEGAVGRRSRVVESVIAARRELDRLSDAVAALGARA
ncbi:hypothetical protein FHN55_17860 [Streptomyces sp. NP160]|uniref:polysaccharide pyruvyl transferase family protein n=1 Tax=Streptomyces sp. NP160 TaxID=2586637 RepID=UPI00111AA4B0|nr:polysaccharide pyruvyl transferase family protein [Streptomyces sp. NP160]TNM61075.1 hypothetical protein FHN55_17860 [Streptomyces sp. NP160]